MDRNPFVSRNNDLFIMFFSGMGTMITTTYLLNLSVQAQFLMVLTIGFLGGLMMNYLYQSLEWALFFMIGIQMVALTPYLLGLASGQSMPMAYLIHHVMGVGRYGLFLLSSWILAIPAGYMLQRLIMGNYYRQSHF